MWLSAQLQDYITPLRKAFSRTATFHWFVVVVRGFILTFEFSGVTSFVRCFALDPLATYPMLIHFFHSRAFLVSELCRLRACVVLRQAPLVKVNGRPLAIGDAIKIPKEGRRMPGVKRQSQDSQDNSKASYVFAHLFNAISFAAAACGNVFAVPLRLGLHDGFKVFTKKKDNPSLVDKMASMFVTTVPTSCYVVLDAYYAAATLLALVVHHGRHRMVAPLRSTR